MDKILVVDSVSKEYPGRMAVKNASFAVTAGSIHGFLGPNGAGKSTTMKMIAGLLPVSSGQIELFGKPIEKQKISELIGMLPENPPLYFDMTVRNYIEYVARLHQQKDIKNRVEKIIADLSLEDVADRLIGNLSKGYKQRVGLAQALVYDAPFIILDEPTNGLDPQSVVELREFIKKLAEQKTILFSSHILSEVEQLCDEITIIHQGEVKASGPIKEIQKMFKQGLVLTVGVPSGQKLPDLSPFGEVQTELLSQNAGEDIYQLIFSNEKDIRGELGRYFYSKGIDLLTLSLDSPELEDIFLQMTEKP
ncbi:MAG TPA: ABC transporter ATP-binding protein [Bacteriovoracaceae bacterium]|nr:ABC transporter ATP-binding protein [Bacteriovoracaceae bacterium]